MMLDMLVNADGTDVLGSLIDWVWNNTIHSTEAGIQLPTQRHLDVVKYLAENNALVNKGRQLMLYEASKRDHLNIVKYFVERNALM